jgi:hypothetical protein
MPRFKLLLLTAFLTFSVESAAITYYVSSTGNDNNPGTINSPWRYCPGMPGWTGSASLVAGDVIYFNNTDTWTAASGNSIIQAVAGVIYDGKTWGAGSKAILRATGSLSRSIVNMMEDHQTLPTVVRGFELDANNQVTSGVGINWPNWTNHLTGAKKILDDCIIHSVSSRQTLGQYQYGIIVSTGRRNVENVEITNCVVYDISRDGIALYPGNVDNSVYLKNILVRNCEVYNTGQDPDYTAGRGSGTKNWVIDGTIEYCYFHNTGGAGLVANTQNSSFNGPENLVLRYNLIKNAGHAGVYIHHSDELEGFEMYGNLIIGCTFEGLLVESSINNTFSARIYNNTFYKNCQGGNFQEVRIKDYSANPSSLEMINNIFYADNGKRCIYDDGSKISAHNNNLYYRNDGLQNTLVYDNGTTYNGLSITNYETAAIASNPLFKDESGIPTGFIGTYSVNLRPNPDGFSITMGSQARDSGLSLDPHYNGSINSIIRPVGSAWDIGAYEYGDTIGTAQVVKPIISPNGGTFLNEVTISLSTVTPGAEIRYTLDGSIPNISSPSYAGPFTLTSDATLKAVAFKNGYDPSEIASANFTIMTGTGTRVADGLLALYTFLEGGGSTVTDVSSVGTPLDLTVDSPGNISWGSGFLSINSATIIKSSGPASKLNSACMASNEITIEAWIKPDNTTQLGPARIVSLSADPFERNFTLGQSSLDYDIRLRTTTTGVNGNQPSLAAANQANTNLQHVIYTRQTNGLATIHIDGTEVANNSAIGGDFSNWNSNFVLGLANELTNDRPWLGEIHLAAVYDRALTSQEVLQNYAAGPNPNPITIIDRDNGSTVSDQFKLEQNFPNPFNPSTRIVFSLQTPGEVRLIIINLNGEIVDELLNKPLPAGEYNTTWNASRFASGVYFYQLSIRPNSANIKHFVDTRKMILLK